MKILITICARGGSKGIPGKNIRPLADMPLIGYSIKVAERMKQKLDVTIGLSTDDDEIRRVASSLGLQSTYTRPAQLSGDTAGKIDTIYDLLLHTENLEGQKFDYILDLDVTSPLRTEHDLMSSFKLLQEDEEAYNIFSVNPAGRNPYFNMVEKQPSGYFGLVKTAADGSILTRQTAPAVYELNASFYWYRRTFFERGFKSPINERSLIYSMEHPCFDLDHPIDFEFMTFLIKENKLSFDF